MTRINCGIQPEELTDKHLFAEIREMKRIPNNIKKGKYVISNIPDTFRLGTGHVKFFYDKLKYLHIRFDKLVSEWKKRGKNVSDYSDSFIDLPADLYNDYTPTKRDRHIVIERLLERDFNSYKHLI